MENENKDKNIILTDEELKEVAGGYGEDDTSSVCKQFNMRECAKHFFCKWENGKCVSKLGQGLTNKNAIVWKIKTRKIRKTSSSPMRN